MRFPPLSVLVLLLASIAIGGLAVHAANPLLYSLEMDQSSSVFHKNPEVLRQLAINSTTGVAPMMQELLDTQQPVALDIRARDLEAARQDLSEYTVRFGSLKITAVNLDMTDPEIQAFMASLRDQGDVLEALRTNTSAFDDLKKLALRVGNQNNSDVQFSIAGQEASLKESFRTLNSRYLSSNATIMNISSRLGLDTGEYQLSVAEIQKLIEEVQADQVAQASPAPSQESRITLLVEPPEARYRDSVQVFGVVTPAGILRQVPLSLDSAPFMTLSTDLKGFYSTTFTVERIRAGEHTISATAANLTPAERILTVTKTGTVTTLTTVPGLLNKSVTGVRCNGSVMANRPVRNAPMTILSDGRDRMNLTTDGDGKYQLFLPLSPGSHTLRAEFSGEGYPLSPSQSNETTIIVPSLPLTFIPSGNPILTYAALAFILLGAGGAAFWYLRSGRKPSRKPAGPYQEPAEAVQIREEIEMIMSEAEREFPQPGSEREAALHNAISGLLGRYLACLTEHGLSEAARLAYLALAGRIAARLNLPAYRTLTPREMSRTLTTENYAGIFGRFVGIYEKIRYGGSRSEQDRRGFEEELQEADTNVAGGND